ncbi:MAG: amino acid adenylation domain-containing protein, partial [Bacteroidota bacterium]
ANDPVGLFTHRSTAMIVGIIGIFRAGGAYVPLDPAYPAGRIAHIVADAGITTLALHPAVAKDLPPGDYQTIEIPTQYAEVSFTPPSVKATDLAYLIYTSGSTGQAKGVAISHRNLVHSTTARFAFFSHQPTAFLLLSSFSFDSSVAGIFWTLSKGGKLVLPPNRIEQDMEQLGSIIAGQAVSHTLLLPSLYQLLLEYCSLEQLQTLRTVMVAGEACSKAVVKAHFAKVPQVALVNEYGPTEGTVWSTAHQIRPEDAQGLVPIGRPIPNVKHYLLDEQLQPVPIGVPGELYLAGPGVATGYWQKPELTAERFLEVTLGEHAGAEKGKTTRVYKTGDLTKYRVDGKIDFLGRADQQVKIRGFRVELEEISRQLDGLLAVREAITVVDEAGMAPRLVAYYTLREACSEHELRQALGQVLPEHMVPAVFMELPAFPRLPNGKLDRKALPAPTLAKTAAVGSTFVAPETATEQLLARTWEKVLKRGAIGLDDNYFAIGGDSIRSIRIISQARKHGLELAPHHIFTHQTVRELAAVLDREASKGAESDAEVSTVVPLRSAGTEDPLFCIHAGGGHVFFYQPLARHLPGDRPVYAIQPPTLAGAEHLPESIAAMAAEYLQEMRKVRPHGPYHLLGTCFSNAVVLELAHQLSAAGESVGSLIFVDSGPTRLEPVPRRRFSPIFTMARILREGNWKLLKRSLYRYWFYARQAMGVPLEDEQGKTLRLTINGLYKLYSDYNWQPVPQQLTLIRSTQFAGDPGKQFHLDQLNKLGGGGLDVRVTEGNHGALFADPFVEGLATTVEACLQEATTTKS